LDLRGDSPEALHARRAMSDYPREACSGIVAADVTLIFQQPDRDGWVFCGCTEFDWRLLRRFGYDACLEISHPLGFVAAINREMLPLVECVYFAKVEYTTRARPFDDTSRRKHAGLIKELKYAYQKEVRALWLPPGPLDTPIQPKLLCVPDARQFCKEFCFDKNLLLHVYS
jgi:hypothetical protein